MRRLKRLGLAALFLALGLFVAGFFVFVKNIISMPGDDTQAADGIVALTGGSSRISDAIALLADGRGRRLMVTGLNPATSRHDLARAMGNKSYLVECCVDLDYEAVNTVGNAMEARDWARKNKFRKLVIVTSNYHMPRTLLELRRVFPEGTFIPHTVESPSMDLKGWWSHLPTLRLLFSEYVKYLAAQARALFAVK